MLPADHSQTEGRLYEQQQQVMTSDTAVGLPLMPSYITIVGAGYIGMEFADVFTAMGAEVTLIEAGDRLLPGVDPAIAQAAERILLQRDGEKPIKLLTNTLAASVRRTQPISEKTDPGPLEVQLRDAKTKESKGVLFPDACLVATGRKPASQVKGKTSDRRSSQLLVLRLPSRLCFGGKHLYTRQLVLMHYFFFVLVLNCREAQTPGCITRYRICPA